MAQTRSKIGLSQVRVGLFILFGMAILAFLILNSTGDFNPFERKLRLRARFASGDGLRDGSEVQLAGVRIGQVESISLLPPDASDNNKVEAVMAVEADLNGRPISDRIKTDSTAQLIATSVLANDKVINITPGTASAGPVAANDVLESGEAISINQLTKTGNDLLQQINKLAVPTNEILTKANRGEGTLGKILNDDSLYANLDTTVAETRQTMLRLQRTLDQVNRGSGTAGKLLNDPALYNSLNRTATQLQAISEDIRAGRGTAGKLVSNDELYNETRAAIGDLRISAQKINSIADDFKLITGDLTAGRGSAGKFLKDEKLYEDAQATLARFNTTAARIDAILADAQAGKGTLGKLITDDALFNNFNQTAANVNQLSSEATKLIYDFRQNPKKYLRIKLSLF